MALLISKLQLGWDEMPFEEYVVMEGDDIIEAEYCMSKLVDMALGHRIEPTSLDLTAETVNPLDVDERDLHLLWNWRMLNNMLSY
jgi:hypothetical protein